MKPKKASRAFTNKKERKMRIDGWTKASHKALKIEMATPNPYYGYEVEKPLPAKKPRGYCSKLKGEHQWQLLETKNFSLGLGGGNGYKILECIGCRKKDIEWF